MKTTFIRATLFQRKLQKKNKKQNKTKIRDFLNYVFTYEYECIIIIIIIQVVVQCKQLCGPRALFPLPHRPFLGIGPPLFPFISFYPIPFLVPLWIHPFAMLDCSLLNQSVYVESFKSDYSKFLVSSSKTGLEKTWIF